MPIGGLMNVKVTEMLHMVKHLIVHRVHPRHRDGVGWDGMYCNYFVERTKEWWKERKGMRSSQLYFNF